MDYTELHLHTYYSLLDGLNSPAEYMKRAKELGMTHLAETEHGTNSGHRDFQKAAAEAGIIPILGQEMYISETGMDDRRPVKKREDNTQAYNHLIVLAQNPVGLSNLNHLSEVAWNQGFYSKPRIDMDILEEYSEGLIVLSGCLNGLISKAIANGMDLKADMFASEFKRIFGERFFMEIQAHNGEQVNNGLLSIAAKHGIEPVVTSDCHYARKEDLWLEEAMLILSTNPKSNREFDFKKAEKMEMLERFNYAYPDRSMSFEQFGLFLHSAEEHLTSKHWHDGMPESTIKRAIANTMVVADMIEPYPLHENLDLLPTPVNLIDTPDDELWRMVIDGAKKRGTYGIPEYDARRNEEMAIIIGKNFSRYFLIESDFIQWGRSQGILFGPGRGSAAGSLVCYELFVTDVNPIEHDLLFFRFINPERNDYPDVDTDVEVKRRSEVKDYMLRKYKNVASIATFGTFAGKNSVRDAARVFMVPLGEVNKALKGADWPNPIWWDEWERTDKGRDFSSKYPKVIELAKFLYGRLRTQGMHAGGIVVANQPISNFAPMQTAKDNSDEAGNRIPLVAVDMEDAADYGLIKYDILGLKALTIIGSTLRMIKERHGIEINPIDIPLDDSKIYWNLSHGETKGVFQCEAVPYTNLLIKMGGVRNFAELAASNALVRPGAMNSTAGAAFIARKKGEQQIDYPHASMHPFTKETYGVVIYQEQVMQTMTELAGMKMSTADKVRKIIGKKRDVAEFEQYKAEFIDGASKNVTAKEAERLWHDFEAHAGYSFNKSHAVAYSMVSYWTAWLKEKYPLEFMTSVLREEGDKDRVLDYLIETKRMGLKVRLPHVNASDLGFSIQSDQDGAEFIRMGLANIKYISGKIGSRLIAYRPFVNYEHLYNTVFTKGSGLSSRTLGSLNAIGAAAFDDHPRTGNERENFFEYLNIPAFPTQDLSPLMKAQFRTLDEFSESDTFVAMGMVRGIKTGPGWARVEIVDETGSAGVFTDEQNLIESGQMYVLLISNNRIARYITVEELLNDQGGDFQEFLEATEFSDLVEPLVRVVSWKTRITKAGKRMADVVVCDEYKDMLGLLVFPGTFMKAYPRMRPGMVVDLDIQTTEDGTFFVKNVK